MVGRLEFRRDIYQWNITLVRREVFADIVRRNRPAEDTLLLDGTSIINSGHPIHFFFFVSTCQICVTKGYSLHFYLKDLTVTKHVCLLVASEFSWLIIYSPVLNRRGGEGHSFTALAKKYPQISFINTPLPCFLNIFPNIFTFNCSFSICSTTYPAFISNILMLPLKWKYLFCQFSHMGSFNYFLM